MSQRDYDPLQGIPHFSGYWFVEPTKIDPSASISTNGTLKSEEKHNGYFVSSCGELFHVDADRVMSIDTLKFFLGGSLIAEFRVWEYWYEDNLRVLNYDDLTE